MLQKHAQVAIISQFASFLWHLRPCTSFRVNSFQRSGRVSTIVNFRVVCACSTRSVWFLSRRNGVVKIYTYTFTHCINVVLLLLLLLFRCTLTFSCIELTVSLKLRIYLKLIYWSPDM